MSYEVLARKYRPMGFQDLVGQEHVARTLANAIDQGRVAHAFLFTGVRGVGKTTSARILAKALNCMRPPGTTPKGVDPGPTHEPCLECDACKEIRTGQDMDVREIDGASYNGVDEVRKLQDSLPYRPSRDRYKIFIVDEVHMLSGAAWNAFLKTLEEPPPHVKFIFATTEAQKIPVTILSRCQRFDFRLIPTQIIAARLRHVLEREQISADETSVSIIAREAAGSMRDAMSLLDQVIAWGGTDLRGDDVARVLGVASRQILHDLAAALIAGDPARCLEVVGQLASQGFDILHVSRHVLALLRDLVVAKVCRTPEDLIDLADEERRDVVALAARTDADDLVRIHQGFSTGFDEIARGGQPRAALEMLLVRLARRPHLIPIDDLVARLAALERRLGARSADDGRPARPGPTPQASPVARSRPREARPSAAAAERAVDPGSDEPPDAAPSAGASEGAGAPGGAAEPPQRARTAPSKDAGPQGRHGRNGADAPPAEAPEASRTKMDRWREVLELVRSERPELAAVLQHAAPLEVSGERLRLGYERGSVWEEHVNADEPLGVVTRAARACFGQETDVSFDFASRNASTLETVATANLREKEARKKAQKELASRHPMVGTVIDVLGARLKGVRIPDDG